MDRIGRDVVVLVPTVVSLTVRAGDRVDECGDALPPGVVRRFGTVRWRHGGESARSLAFSPDSSRLRSLLLRRRNPRTAKEHQRQAGLAAAALSELVVRRRHS